MRETADALGVSPARVRVLITAGALPAHKMAVSYLLNEDAVAAFADRHRPAHVRAFSPRIAWACAAVADGDRPGWIRDDKLSRLRSRLEHAEDDPWLWLARLPRLAAQENRYRVGPGQAADLVTDARTARAGASATNLVTDAIVDVSVTEVWVNGAHSLEDLSSVYGLPLSRTGNVVHVAGVDGLTRLAVTGRTPIGLLSSPA